MVRTRRIFKIVCWVLAAPIYVPLLLVTVPVWMTICVTASILEDVDDWIRG